MKKLFEILSLSVFLFLFAVPAHAQNLTKIENKYLNAQNDLKQESFVLDSLKNILELRVKKIDYEKNKANPDKDLIVKLMSGSASISNEIESQQNKIDLTQKKIEEFRKVLNQLYSEKIDSLQELERSGDFKGNRNSLKASILSFTEEKLSVAPKISILSFHPGKILEIDLNKIKDPTERKMYKDYLQSALTEVDTRLKDINESINEADKIITLQKKTNKFIEESDFEYGVTPQNNISLSSTDAVGNTSPAYFSNTKAAYAQNINEYSLLLNQLNFKPITSKINLDVSIKGKSSVHNLSDYNELQKEVKKRLLEYKLILTHKLNADK